MINETHLTPKALEAQSFTDLDLSPKLCKHNLWGVFIMNVKGRILGFANQLSATTQAHLNSLLSQYTRPCFSIESQTSPNECTAAQGCADVEYRSRNLICFSNGKNVRKKLPEKSGGKLKFPMMGFFPQR